MFYSKDILHRKSPLGAIWTIAHGKKLSKHKMLGISVKDICNQILSPDVPHSLRLQGILIGGVVVVFNRQAVYLLEDMQDMMKRLKEAINLEQAGAVTAGKATLQKGKERARKEAITLLDEEEDRLNGHGGEDAAMDPNNLIFFAPAPGLVLMSSQQLLGDHLNGIEHPLPATHDSELFAVSLRSARGTTSALTHTTTGTGQEEVAMGQRRAEKILALTQRPGAQKAGRGPAAMVAEEDELFDEDAGAMLLEGLGDFMDLGQLVEDPNNASEASHADGSKRSSKADGSKAGPSDGSPKGSKRGSELGSIGDERDQDTEHDEEADRHGPAPEDAAAAVEGLREEYDAHDKEHLVTEEGEEEQEGAAQQAGKGKQKGKGGKAKAGAGAGDPHVSKKARLIPKARATTALMDTVDGIQIKPAEFREWVTDTSPLLTQRGLLNRHQQHQIPNLGAASHLVTPGLSPSLFSRSATAARAAGGGGAGADNEKEMLPAWLVAGPLLEAGGGVAAPPLADSMRAMFHSALLPAADKAPRRKAGGAAADEDDDDDGAQPAGRGGANKRRKLANGKAKAAAPAAATAAEGDVPQGHQLEEHEAHEEMHDQLHELPFGGDIEIERLRAGSPMGSGSLQRGAGSGLVGGEGLGSGAARLLGQGLGVGALRAPGSRATSDASGSSIQLGQVQRAQRETSVSTGVPGSGADGLGKATGSGARGGVGEPHPYMHWGNGALEDLLPELGDGGLGDDLFNVPSLAASGGSGRRSGRLDGGDEQDGYRMRPRRLATLPSLPGSSDEQLRLLETAGDNTQELLMASGGSGALVLPAGSDTTGGSGGALSKNAQMVIKIVHKELTDQAGAGMPDPHVSLFSTAQRLTRSEAVKLFVQVLVTQTAGYTKATQDEPYGDILIRAGKRMAAQQAQAA